MARSKTLMSNFMENDTLLKTVNSCLQIFTGNRTRRGNPLGAA